MLFHKLGNYFNNFFFLKNGLLNSMERLSARSLGTVTDNDDGLLLLL